MCKSSMNRAWARPVFGIGVLVVAVVPFAASIAKASVILSLSSVSASGPSTADPAGTYNFSPSDLSFTSSPIANGIQTVGSLHATGAEFLNALNPTGYYGGNLVFTGPANGVVDAGDEMFTNFEFSYTISGGQAGFFDDEYEQLLQNGDGTLIFLTQQFGYYPLRQARLGPIRCN
jgi:hypothetical protein